MTPEITSDLNAGFHPLQGKAALVTGASGGGVGSTTARLLAARGAAVAVNYLRNRESAERVVADVIAAGGRARAVRADVGDAEQVERMVGEVLATYGRLDILVSNAGAGGHFRPGPFIDLSWEDFARGQTGRLKAAFLATQAVVPAMRQQGAGRLIYIGSDHAEGPAAPGMIVNGTSAAALVAFVRYLACELGPWGITANVVSPGMIESTATARAVQVLPPGFKERIVNATPLGRIATPEDVARIIAFFAGEDGSFVTGTVGHVNGGFGIARLPLPPKRGHIPEPQGE